MSGIVRTFAKGVESFGTWFGVSKDKWNRLDNSSVGKAFGMSKSLLPQKPPGVPTIGDAQLGADQQADFMRRRRGVLANLYGGGAGNAGPGAAPGSSGGATLLGQ